MYIKDNLKKLNKKHVAVMVVSAVLAAGTLIGCGAKADSGGAEVSTEAVGSDAINLVETEPEGDVEAREGEMVAEASVEDDLPALAYRTVEERMAQGKPGAEDLEKLGLTSNKFMMVEEVCDIEELFKDPEFVWPEELHRSNNSKYIKLKGTLYELYFYDEPEYDLVYFPGDELSEGYEVRETGNFEVVIRDSDYFGEGHSIRVDTNAYPVVENSGTLSYKRFGGAFKVREDIEFDENYLPKDDPNMPASEVVIKPGMYISLIEPGRYYDAYTIYQILTKEDLEALPEGITLADDVVHY